LDNSHIVDTDSVFNGIERWRLGFSTANEAGAMLACILPISWFLWAVSDRWWQTLESTLIWNRRFTLGRISAAIVGGSGWYAMARTGSRGGWAAAIVSAAAFHGWLLVREASCVHVVSWRVHLRWAFVEAAIAVSAILVSGQSGRASLTFMAGDRSVVNRCVLWLGGIEMVANAPFTGWGSGESGRAFMNWTQPLNGADGYSTMINSFLQIAVEKGLVCFALIVAVVAFFVLLPAILLPRRRIKFGTEPVDTLALNHCKRGSVWWLIVVLASCVWVAWIAANIFSTLWIDRRLWIFPSMAGLAGLAAVMCDGDRKRFLQVAGLASCAGVSAAGLLWATGVFIARQRPWRLEHLTAGVVRLEVCAWDDRDCPQSDFIVWTDKAVLGAAPGKEMRRWVETRPGPRCITVCDPRLVCEGSVAASGSATWILAGDQCWRMTLAPPNANLILLHPRGLPPEATLKRLILVLPDFDPGGMNAAWESWAKEGGVPIVINTQTGDDIRPAWPAVMTTVCEQLATQRSAL
jgi:hypothetical protein